jgi:hypothetical protein
MMIIHIYICYFRFCLNRKQMTLRYIVQVSCNKNNESNALSPAGACTRPPERTCEQATVENQGNRSPRCPHEVKRAPR